MKTSIGIFVLSIVILSISCKSNTVSVINGDLAKRKIPTLPPQVKILGLEEGGLFASWYFTAAKMDQAQRIEYQNKLSPSIYKIDSIGIGKGKYLIIKVENIKEKFSRDQLYSYQQELNGEYISWWKTDLIREGKIYVQKESNVEHHTIYIDEKENIVYIYWCYS
jgi:hypothetical protein